MKIQIASDLHLEHWQRDLPPLHLFVSDRTRDLLILAGDITDGRTDFGLPFIKRELGFSPLVYVPGNHEYYFAPSRQKVDDWWREFARYHPGFYYLNDDTADIGGVRLYGACWCSDFWGHPDHVHYTRAIADFTVTGDWDTAAHVAEFKRVTESMAGLAGKVDVVITHFPPTLEAIDRNLYQANPLNPYFINDCEWLVQYLKPALWVSGHTHSPFDYRVGDTRVVINPGGYREEGTLPGFSAMKTVTVEV